VISSTKKGDEMKCYKTCVYPFGSYITRLKYIASYFSIFTSLCSQQKIINNEVSNNFIFLLKKIIFFLSFPFLYS